MKIFLHVGEGKCASSSIQYHFSQYNIQGKFAYGIVEADGNIIVGDAIDNAVKRAQIDFISSYYFKNSANSLRFLKNMLLSLSKYAKKYDTMFLSHEGWHHCRDTFNNFKNVFEGHTVEILFIVRPPVQWVNSAWWQWVYWDEDVADIDTWAKHVNKSRDWMKIYTYFKKLPFVNKFHMFSLQKNIIEHIYACMGLQYTYRDEKIVNKSSSAELLNFMAMRKELHKNTSRVGYEFILNKYIKMRSPTNWVLSRENIQNILHNTKEHNYALAKLIHNEDILCNKAWWDIAYYEDKIAMFTRNTDIPYETLCDMLEEAYLIICNNHCKLSEIQNVYSEKFENLKRTLSGKHLKS